MSIPVLIIPVLNRFDLLETTLRSIDYPIDEILILNNSGVDSNTDGLKERLPHLNIRVLNLPSNLGVSGSWNLGIKLYPHSDYWMFGAADTHYLPGILESLYPHFDKESVFYIHSFGSWILGSEVVKKVGLFDENYYPAYFEDWDYNKRLDLAGIHRKNHIDYGIAQTVNDNGDAQTVKSDPKMSEGHQRTFPLLHSYFNEKEQSGNWDPKPWNLDTRRNNEWIVD